MTRPALAVIRLSQVAAGTTFCRLGGVLWATVVVKATFELVHGEDARRIAPEELVSADRLGPGGGLERACEVVPHLPNAGVLLGGHACAPAGRAVPSMSVRLAIFRDRPIIEKTLHIFGSRSASDPRSIVPFQKIPIVYERAFGGAGVPENPVGVGGPGSAILPGIIDPKEPRRPAGFGPIAPSFAPRRSARGGLDPAALVAPVPELPSDFDFRYFQAAPADQQTDGLQGDEWIVLDGLSPSLPRVQSRLPRVAARARRQVISDAGTISEHPVDLRADMLVIDADRMTASLIWRGRFTVESPAALATTRLLVGLEGPGEAVPWPLSGAAPAGAKDVQAATTEVNVAAILGAKVPFSPARGGARGGGISAPAGAASAPATPVSKVPVPSAREGARGGGVPAATTEVNVAAILGAKVPFSPARGGTPAESLPEPVARGTPMSTGTTDINLAELLKGAALHRGAGGAPAAPPAVAARPAPLEAAAPPLLVVEPPAVAAPPLVEPPAADLLRAVATEPVAPVAAESPPPAAEALARVAPPPAAAEPPAPLAPPAVAAAPPRGASETQPVAVAAALARKRAESLLESGLPFDGEDFRGANLSGLDLTERSLVRCNLRGARLRGTKLDGAVLRGAVLDEADLRGAVLEGADLREASLVRADLERARIGRCDGTGATLREASLIRADLRSSRFAGASFESAVLRDAVADRSDMTGARFVGADLSASSFREARLSSAVLAHANLDRADLQRAVLEGANLHGASRRMTRLAGADLTGVVEDPPGVE